MIKNEVARDKAARIFTCRTNNEVASNKVERILARGIIKREIGLDKAEGAFANISIKNKKARNCAARIFLNRRNKFLSLLINHFATLTFQFILLNYTFQPNVAIMRFEYTFEVIALG